MESKNTTIAEVAEITPLVFCEAVERLKKQGTLNYIECVIEVAKEFEIDPEDVKTFVLQPLLVKLTYEAQSLNLLKERRSRTNDLTALLQ